MQSLLLLALLLLTTSSYSFTIQPLHSNKGSLSSTQRYQSESCLYSSAQSDNDDSSSPQDDAANEIEPVYETVIKMDDGGSDLTDRFKYKVNALMGVFDPQTGVDDEHQSGNIVNALLKFPAQYSFNVVGRTSGDDALKEEFVREIKDIVSSLSGDDKMEVRITPRGKNFTRITLQATVESVAVMNSIYDALEKNEKTVMQY